MGVINYKICYDNEGTAIRIIKYNNIEYQNH